MEKKPFEKSIQELENIVKDLESADLPLEKALKKFEQGIKISKDCSAKLDEAEKKITVLLKNANGDETEKSFLPNDDDDGDNGSEDVA